MAQAPTQADAVRDQLADIFEQYEHRLFNFLIALSQDREVAADCLQQTFLLALENLRRGKPVNQSWLYKVARSKGIDELRRRQDVREGLQEAHAWVDVSHAALEPQFARALNRLAADERELLYLYDADGLSAQEIGHMLGVRPGAVRMRVLRAREHFRAFSREETG